MEVINFFALDNVLLIQKRGLSEKTNNYKITP